jgi:hypothetical protein
LNERSVRGTSATSPGTTTPNIGSVVSADRVESRRRCADSHA